MKGHMGANMDDSGQLHQQAHTAYVQGNYELAATLVDQVVANLPDDPNIHLLRGHIYYVQQQYDVAREEYQRVLQLTKDPEMIEFASNGLDSINQVTDREEIQTVLDVNDSYVVTVDKADQLHPRENTDTLASTQDFIHVDQTVSNSKSEQIFDNPFGMDDPTTSSLGHSGVRSENPFGLDHQDNSFSTGDLNHQDNLFSTSGSLNHQDNLFSTGALNHQDNSFSTTEDFTSNSHDLNENGKSPPNHEIFAQYDSALDDYSTDSTFEESDFLNKKKTDSHHSTSSERTYLRNSEDETLLMGQSPINPPSENSAFGSSPAKQPSSFEFNQVKNQEQNGFHADDGFDFAAFESAFGSESMATSGELSSSSLGQGKNSNIEFLDDFDEFDDLGNIPGFDLTEDSTFGEIPISAGSNTKANSQNFGFHQPDSSIHERDNELFSITGSSEAVPAFTQTNSSQIEPQVSVEQGWLAFFENAPLETKKWLTAGTVGIVSALVVATVSFTATSVSPAQQREGLLKTGWAMALFSGLAGFATTGLMTNLTIKQMRQTTDDLHHQFNAVREGNLNAQATVYSEDEFGRLSSGFNEMTRVILATTTEAQRKAQEQEEAKENLQRQVIRLLDDVEGAARGDLTVQAEVTADVLGAVADAFNLTIQNLRDIVQQVKLAAREVTKGATNSESFARSLSSDALRQAEELAVTLNSVQVMTDTIQRVAASAREAEVVARSASSIALKGGEAVENTVSGILEIRDTVAETTRKVKRLAESSQEISKIVALISQIASRTNLLALNASIEAARAGEAGRGFAIVADEVRQLADKSAKSLKEIEQIVMQIQSETTSVMTAMEEGTQQVIKGTHLAEQAKRSLEDIIQVANRIDALVRSITADTVEQTETSRAVASVMQSVELTAQETSQEAQRVSGALQNLVGVSRDLIASVERFRVDTTESR